MSKNESFGSSVGEGIGCLFIVIAIVILFNMQWFMSLVEKLLLK